MRPHDVQHLPGLCLLYIGMRVLLYSKDCIRLGLMNGCECVVEHIVFADEEHIPDDGDLVAGRAHRLQYMPTALLLRSVDAPWQLPVGTYRLSQVISLVAVAFSSWNLQR